MEERKIKAYFKRALKSTENPRPTEVVVVTTKYQKGYVVKEIEHS